MAGRPPVSALAFLIPCVLALLPSGLPSGGRAEERESPPFFPIGTVLSPGQEVVYRRGASVLSLASGDSVHFNWADGRLLLNGVQVRPLAAVDGGSFSLGELQGVYGNVRRVRELAGAAPDTDEERQWRRAIDAYLEERRGLLAEIHATYDSLFPVVGAEDAALHCAWRLRDHPLVEWVQPRRAGRLDPAIRTLRFRFQGSLVGSLITLDPGPPLLVPDPPDRIDSAEARAWVALLLRHLAADPTARIDLSSGLGILGPR